MKEIQCLSCGYSNEITRVFCHQCGVRLPRTEAQVEEVAQTNQVAAQKAKVLRQKGPRKAKARFDFSDFMAGLIASSIKLSILALIIAAIVLGLRSPDDVPAPAAEAPHVAQQLQNKLAEIQKIGYTGHLLATPVQLNTFLSQRVQMQTSQTALARVLQPDTLAVRFENQGFTLFLTYRLLEQPLVLQTRFDLVGSARKWDLRVGESRIGKLPLHPLIVEKAFRWYEPVAKTLANPLHSLSLAAEITLTPGFLRAAWKMDRPDPAPIQGFDQAPSMNPTPPSMQDAPTSSPAPLQLRGLDSSQANPTPLQMRGSNVNEQLQSIQEQRDEQLREINRLLDAD